MKKTLGIILAVAILGSVGIYAKHAKDQPNGSGSASQPTASSSILKSYQDGTYTGDAAETPYGIVQIAVVVSGGKLSDVRFLKMPDDFGRSTEITQNAEPQLKQTTLNKQSANIDFVSGATSTSYGYQQSLQAALDTAAKA